MARNGIYADLIRLQVNSDMDHSTSNPGALSPSIMSHDTASTVQVTLNDPQFQGSSCGLLQQSGEKAVKLGHEGELEETLEQRNKVFMVHQSPLWVQLMIMVS
jgi:hypothetical protein